MDTPTPFPLFPEDLMVLNAEEKPFFDASAEGRFLLKSCNECGKAHWYPRAACPFCHSIDTCWITGSGRGAVLSWTVMRRAKVPYALAYVTLEEGPSMMSNIVECDLDTLRVGMPVELVFGQANGVVVPRFRPVRVDGA
ncbi:Zn-ribbon domain-containing OB-fold protein [Gluconacetobacter sacchari]|uniref:Zn-ribbon domain-containing OB-fold protein n=1 Tax=Gluconacetobacter sacchari TaxID=92759 RepID=UPI0039B52388